MKKKTTTKNKVTGLRFTLNAQNKDVCPKCYGDGTDKNGNTCGRCGGSGRI